MKLFVIFTLMCLMAGCALSFEHSASLKSGKDKKDRRSEQGVPFTPPVQQYPWGECFKTIDLS